MAVTAQQIADLAGVSRGTVDRALHNRGRVNPEVKEKIQKIALELRYKPNLIGQALVRSKQDFKLGVILQLKYCLTVYFNFSALLMIRV